MAATLPSNKFHNNTFFFEVLGFSKVCFFVFVVFQVDDGEADQKKTVSAVDS
jgi:hypothetical protein